MMKPVPTISVTVTSPSGETATVLITATTGRRFVAAALEKIPSDAARQALSMVIASKGRA